MKMPIATSRLSVVMLKKCSGLLNLTAQNLKAVRTNMDYDRPSRRVLYVTRMHNEFVLSYIINSWIGCLADKYGSIEQAIEYTLILPFSLLFFVSAAVE